MVSVRTVPKDAGSIENTMIRLQKGGVVPPMYLNGAVADIKPNYPQIMRIDSVDRIVT
jgi:hypothetical protein